MPCAGHPGPSGLTATVCRDTDEFGRLAAEWTALHRRCATATPFQSHAWLHSWWLSYGTPGRLRLVLVRRDGVLVAVAPLHRTGGPLPRLTPLGGAITDFSDVLIADDCPEALPSLTDALADLARTAVVEFREVRPDAAVHRVRALWRGPSRVLPDSVCMELPALPMDRLVELMPSSKAQRTRAKVRKIDAAGIDRRPVDAGDVPAALRRLLALHRRQWQGRGVTPEHLTDRFAAHLERSATAMVADGGAAMTEFSIDGELVAADLTLLSPTLSGGYLYGADPVLRSLKVDVATLLLRNNAEEASAAGRTTLSMLRGAEPYKNQWYPQLVRNQRLLLARRPYAPAVELLAAKVRGRIWARDTVRGWQARRQG
ncbi:GNAT family N-acetyltransferase [Streptomyces sp. NPDC060194]|uniref:GNAT family N-acetyltransferase n=1 Tax=Streptomyces sp. NPDC060194 TaxID=3347069 RepID=UPI003658C825